MSRRDTIIVAILVNAALLMILFATASRSKEEPATLALTNMELAEQSVEKEDLLNQLISSAPTLAETQLDTTLAATQNFEAEEIVQEIPTSVLSTLPSIPVIEEPRQNSNRPQTEMHYVNITVKKGDVLEKIARANQTTVTAIMKSNNLTSTQLKIGQNLKIPLANGRSLTPAAPLAPVEEEYYVVKEGDNPWLIASKNHVKLDQLLQLNGLNEEKARRLRPGDRLRIR